MTPARSLAVPVSMVLIAALLAACVEQDDRREFRVVGGDAERGRTAFAAYDCGVCHVVPGLLTARGTVGPSLEGFGRRAYIAGVIPNRPGKLTAWIEDPPSLAPDTAMPDVGVSAEDAKDIAAYLYTLR